MEDTRKVTITFEYAPRHSRCNDTTDEEIAMQLKAHLGHAVHHTLHVPTKVDEVVSEINSFTLIGIT